MKTITASKYSLLPTVLLLIVCLLVSCSNRARKVDLNVPLPEEIDQSLYDVKVAIQKNICGEGGIDMNYIYLQALYRKALEKYLFSSMSIADFEQQLNESGLDFIPTRRYMNQWQKYSSLPSKYFYLLNTIHIEYLKEEDIVVLQSYVDDNNTDVNDELIELAKRTFKEILRFDIKAFNTHLRLANNSTSVPNALVIGISSAIQYDDQGRIVSRENEMSKRAFVESLIPDMERDFSKQLGHTVGVFQEK